MWSFRLSFLSLYNVVYDVALAITTRVEAVGIESHSSLLYQLYQRQIIGQVTYSVKCYTCTIRYRTVFAGPRGVPSNEI